MLKYEAYIDEKTYRKPHITKMTLGNEIQIPNTIIQRYGYEVGDMFAVELLDNGDILLQYAGNENQ